MTEVIELDCHDWKYQQKNPSIQKILNNQGAYATVRKTSNGVGKPATWELFTRRQVPEEAFEGSAVFDTIVTLSTLSKDLVESKVETDIHYTGSHNEARGEYSDIMVTGWKKLDKNGVNAVNIILDWMKADKNKRAEIKKLEDAARKLRGW